MPRKPRPVRMEGVYATPMASRPPTEKYPERWYWRARATVDGREVSLFAGRYTRPEVVVEIGRRIAAGLLLEHEPTEVETMGDLVNAWGADMADRPDLAQSTRANMVRALRRVMPLIEDVRVVDMGARHVERAHRTLLRSYAPSSAHLSLRYVGQVWRWGRLHGLAPQRDLRVPARTKVRVYNHHTPTGEDVAATVAAMPDGWVQEIARLLWATGCRLGEVLYLEWSAIDLGPRQHIRVTGKTGARRVPLSDAAAARLRALHATRDPEVAVWHGRSRASPTTVRDAIRRACEAAGVEVWTPHGLRRLAATEMARAGVPIPAAAEVLGHSPEMMLRVYAQVLDEDRAAAVAVLGPSE